MLQRQRIEGKILRPRHLHRHIDAVAFLLLVGEIMLAFVAFQKTVTLVEVHVCGDAQLEIVRALLGIKNKFVAFAAAVAEKDLQHLVELGKIIVHRHTKTPPHRRFGAAQRSRKKQSFHYIMAPS